MRVQNIGNIEYFYKDLENKTIKVGVGEIIKIEEENKEMFLKDGFQELPEEENNIEVESIDDGKQEISIKVEKKNKTK